jgi:hypothetical protein
LNEKSMKNWLALILELFLNLRKSIKLLQREQKGTLEHILVLLYCKTSSGIIKNILFNQYIITNITCHDLMKWSIPWKLVIPKILCWKVKAHQCWKNECEKWRRKNKIEKLFKIFCRVKINRSWSISINREENKY